MSDPEKRERFDKETQKLAATLAAGLLSRVPEVRSIGVFVDWQPEINNKTLVVLNSQDALSVETIAGLMKRNADIAVMLAEMLRNLQERKPDGVVKPSPDSSAEQHS